MIDQFDTYFKFVIFIFPLCMIIVTTRDLNENLDENLKRQTKRIKISLLDATGFFFFPLLLWNTHATRKLPSTVLTDSIQHQRS